MKQDFLNIVNPEFQSILWNKKMNRQQLSISVAGNALHEGYVDVTSDNLILHTKHKV